MQEHHEELGNAKSPSIVRWALVLVTAGLLALVILALMSQNEGPLEGAGRPKNSAEGTKLDQIELQSLFPPGPDVTSADLEGKVALVNFGGPWCGFCVLEFPHLVDLEKKFRDEPDFRLLAVSCSGDARATDLEMLDSTRRFYQRQKAEFPAYRDGSSRTRDYLMRTLKQGTSDDFIYPVTLVLDRDGVIRGFWRGFKEGYELEMLDVITEALREKPAEKK